jgi:hypothetical protein
MVEFYARVQTRSGELVKERGVAVAQASRELGVHDDGCQESPGGCERAAVLKVISEG